MGDWVGDRLTPNRPGHWHYCAVEFSNDYTLAKAFEDSYH